MHSVQSGRCHRADSAYADAHQHGWSAGLRRRSATQSGGHRIARTGVRAANRPCTPVAAPCQLPAQWRGGPCQRTSPGVSGIRRQGHELSSLAPAPLVPNQSQTSHCGAGGTGTLCLQEEECTSSAAPDWHPLGRQQSAAENGKQEWGGSCDCPPAVAQAWCSGGLTA